MINTASFCPGRRSANVQHGLAWPAYMTLGMAAAELKKASVFPTDEFEHHGREGVAVVPTYDFEYCVRRRLGFQVSNSGRDARDLDFLVTATVGLFPKSRGANLQKAWRHTHSIIQNSDLIINRISQHGCSFRFSSSHERCKEETSFPP
jgi:hypothetical protein